MNLQRAGGTACRAALQASSVGGMHTTRFAAHFGSVLAQTSLRTITRKAGNPLTFTRSPQPSSRRILILERTGGASKKGSGGSLRDFPLNSCEGFVDQVFEVRCPTKELGTGLAVILAAMKELIRDVECGQDRHSEGIDRLGLEGGRLYLCVDVRGQLGNVGCVQRTADGISLPLDLDGHDASGCVGHS